MKKRQSIARLNLAQCRRGRVPDFIDMVECDPIEENVAMGNYDPVCDPIEENIAVCNFDPVCDVVAPEYTLGSCECVNFCVHDNAVASTSKGSSIKSYSLVKASGQKNLEYGTWDHVRNKKIHALARGDDNYRLLEQEFNTLAHQYARQDLSNRRVEQSRGTDAHRVARSQCESNSVNLRSTSTGFGGLSVGKGEVFPCVRMSHLTQLRVAHFAQLSRNNFDTNLFVNNPLIASGVEMHRDLYATSWQSCCNCHETYIDLKLSPRSRLCERCVRNKDLFADVNDLTPSPAPECLKCLTQVEKSAISLICPVLAIYKKGWSTSSKGHTLSVFQNVNELADALPRLPRDLPIILIKGPNEMNVDQVFRVRREKIVAALEYLQANNEDYRHITISCENASHYPVDDILQELPAIDPSDWNIPDDEMTAANPDSVVADASMVALPLAGESVLDNIAFHLKWPKREARPASEFMTGYFSKSFPDLFPDGCGDLTKSRLGKNPSLREYFKHLMRVSRDFVEHHCFTFVATNMVRRHEALTLGNVFAKRCVAELSVGELKAAVESGNESVLNMLLYFAAPISGTRQYLRYKSDQAISLVRFLRISSDDKEMFNFFQTFSAADVHWDDLHRLLPGSEEYLGRQPVDCLESLPEGERHRFIQKQNDHLLRCNNLARHADIVDMYFHNRVQKMLQHVFPKLGVEEWICRYEVQARGTIHAHLLLHVKGGPSHGDLECAFKSALSPEVLEAREKVTRFSSHTVGISAVHPNPNPVNWPGPHGQNVYTPSVNCLRVPFLKVVSENEIVAQYERLINRCMLHVCRRKYCYSDSNPACRFKFPMELHGFDEASSPEGHPWSAIVKVDTPSDVGSDFVSNKLVHLRNHPTLVHHVPEFLLIWGANVEGRPVQSYQQLLRYLLKYMMKSEPNSAPFKAICRGVIAASEDDEPVRKSFQKVLMKTVGEHDLSKQECHHILNGLEFVYFSREFVCVNVLGTKQVRNDLQGDQDPVTKDNLASVYWNRVNDPNYLGAMNCFEAGSIMWNPAAVSLYEFASKYTKKWKVSGKVCVPHITPNFNVIPPRDDKIDGRYVKFLRALLLSHKAGTRLTSILALSLDDLEIEVREFVESEGCPLLIREEFVASHTVVCSAENVPVNGGNQVMEGNDSVEMSGVDNVSPEVELFVEPEHVAEDYEQDEWMRALRIIRPIHEEQYDDDAQYDDLEFVGQARNHNWQEDRLQLGLSDEDLNRMSRWIDETKKGFVVSVDCGSGVGVPLWEQLNYKQTAAFNIIRRLIVTAKECGVRDLPQLLLNISGGAGTGKTFWLNAVRHFAAQEISPQFVKAAAPSGTAAFLISGVTLHNLLYLPLSSGKFEPLEGERLRELQQKFENVGVLVIDEKSMIGQEVFWMVSERLKEARPYFATEPFGNLSVVLLGDWRQLPPVGDSSLFSMTSKQPRGHNLYMLFKDVIMFDVCERQAGDDQALFREELQSLGDGKFTSDMWRRWRERTFDMMSGEVQREFVDTGILACALKKDMVAHNIMKVKANNLPVAPIFSESFPNLAKNDSSERASGLLSKIIISKNSIIRLSNNLWIEAGLTNGAVGKIYAIIYENGKSPPALPVGVIAVFDEYKGPWYLPDVPRSVPIVPVRRVWFSNRVQCTRIMLPIILGYALSIHKLQGSTCEKVILNPGKKEFATGLMLVGVTRTKKFENLAFAPFPNFSRFQQVNKSKALQKRLEEEERMLQLEAATLRTHGSQ